MNAPSVHPLTHTAPAVAAAIHRVMTAAYRVEAELLGVTDFPPLSRTIAQIAAADAQFFGISPDNTLAAVTEIERQGPRHTNIASVVVLPSHFRQHLATALLHHLIHTFSGHDFTVSTGVLNEPALNLYAAQGFHEQRRWTTYNGIAMITLLRPG